MPTVKLSNKSFEKRFKFDWSNERLMKKVFTDDVIKEMTDSSEAIQELEAEWDRLVSDRDSLRQIFPNGESKVVLPCNLQRMIWNVQKIFHINKRLPTDLSPIRVIKGVKTLLERCVIVTGNDRISKQANDWRLRVPHDQGGLRLRQFGQLRQFSFQLQGAVQRPLLLRYHGTELLDLGQLPPAAVAQARGHHVVFRQLKANNSIIRKKHLFGVEKSKSTHHQQQMSLDQLGQLAMCRLSHWRFLAENGHPVLSILQAESAYHLIKGRTQIPSRIALNAAVFDSLLSFVM